MEDESRVLHVLVPNLSSFEEATNDATVPSDAPSVMKKLMSEDRNAYDDPTAKENQVLKCCVLGCPNNSAMQVVGLEFWKFPQQNADKCRKWIETINNPPDERGIPWAPHADSRICNGHFFMKQSDTENPTHPSYKPVFFPHMDKETRKKIRKICKEKLLALIPDTLSESKIPSGRKPRKIPVRGIPLDELPIRKVPSSTENFLPINKINEAYKRIKRRKSDGNGLEEVEGVKPSKLNHFLSSKVEKSATNSSSKHKKIYSRDRYCCVVGCYNNSNTPKIRLFDFPKRGSDQYKSWLKAINRINSDGAIWKPSSDSVICSVHFYGEETNPSSRHLGYTPVFFPYNINHWDEISVKLKEREVVEAPSDFIHELELLSPPKLSQDVKLVYPYWMPEIAEYILECKETKKFTDIVISNGRQSFEGHRIILMSALPMIKMALFSMDSHDSDDKPVVILPDMTTNEMIVLEQVIYNKNASSIFKNFDETPTYSSTDTNCNPWENKRPRIEDEDLVSTSIVPIPSDALEQNISSKDFFRLYNNVACKAAKNKTLLKPLNRESKEMDFNVTNGIFQTSGESGKIGDQNTISSIMKQVTSIRAINPKKFTVRDSNKKYTVIVQTVKKPDQLDKPPPPLEELRVSRADVPTQPYCSACEKEFDCPLERDKHKVTHLSEPDLFPDSSTCKFCGKNFKTVEGKRIHEAYHTKIGWKCDICEKGFPTPPKLLEHSFTHKTTSRFMCQFCSKGFRVKSKLNLHENMHRNISKHKCEYCLRLFISARSLADHMNFHTGLKPYVCDKCGKSFCTSPSLSQHRSRVHNRNESMGRHKCKHCGKRFRYKSVMMNHTEHCELQFISSQI